MLRHSASLPPFGSRTVYFGPFALDTLVIGLGKRKSDVVNCFTAFDRDARLSTEHNCCMAIPTRPRLDYNLAYARSHNTTVASIPESSI